MTDDIFKDDIIYLWDDNDSNCFTKKDATKSIDELVQRGLAFRNTQQYKDFLKFLTRFRHYSLYNNMLIYTQNPNTTFFATASHWWREFGRSIKDNARPMVMLVPMGPVQFVYDYADTEGNEILPEYLHNPFLVEGKFNDSWLKYTLANSSLYKISVLKEKKSFLRAGEVQKEMLNAASQKNNNTHSFLIRINDELDNKSTYATLVHELAHIFLGHLGEVDPKLKRPKGMPKFSWGNRRYLPRDFMELEAESCAFLVCSRLGLETKSVEYIAGYAARQEALSEISVDLIIKGNYSVIPSVRIIRKFLARGNRKISFTGFCRSLWQSSLPRPWVHPTWVQLAAR